MRSAEMEAFVEDYHNKIEDYWPRFWLIYLIEGTKDFFTQRTGEFIANIALIEDGEPILGVLTAPALKEA